MQYTTAETPNRRERKAVAKTAVNCMTPTPLA
jgi:hypothetical protein